MSKHNILILLFSFYLISIQLVIGQTDFRSNSEIKANAAKYFAADQFNLAFPLYSQLLSLDPKNSELNYRFGVCLMYTERSNTEEPIAYLEKAINQVTDIDLYYHLGFAYHNNYFFTDAIYNYRKYLHLAKNTAHKDYDVKRKIAMCQNGIEILRSADDLFVMQKSEVDRKAFYRSYSLLNYGGRILSLPDEFLNKADLKNQQENIAFFNPNAKLLFYALENKNHKDIYYRIRKTDGEWTKAIALGTIINTAYDEDYPVLMSDGKTLYFSSNGHNTMGGYDIFQTVYDSISQKWSPPKNLSFPFNTPSDDILFIPDATETKAWFASNRNSINDKISVYNVGIIKKEEVSTDLTDIYAKAKLSSEDLGRIRNMAQLDINISDKEFKEIPIDQKQKLDALKKKDANRISQNIHQANLINVNKQISTHKMQTGLNDSIKNIVNQINSKLESLKSIYLHTQELVLSKANATQLAYSELSIILEKAQKTAPHTRRKELIDKANKTLFKALRYDIQHNKLKIIEHAIDNQVENQRQLLFKANNIFGDIQKSIVTRSENETRKNIRQLNQLIQNADTLTDYNKIVNYSTGELFYPNYPSNLLDENAFTAYYIENEYLAPILAIETHFSKYIPEISESKDLDLLKSVENITSNARLKNKQFSFQLKILRSLINEKNQATTLLLKEANQLVKKFNNKPSAGNLSIINAKYAEARRTAVETRFAQQIYDSLKLTSSLSEGIASELTSLKSEIEILIEQDKNQQASVLKAKIDKLEAQADQLQNYNETIDFENKEILKISYPSAIQNINNYVEYVVLEGRLQRRSGNAFTYQTVNELMASNDLLKNLTAKPESTLNPIATSPENNQVIQQIRKKLAKLNRLQTSNLEQLEQHSILLTQKASKKLDASNAALLDFERMREQYHQGQISDKNIVITKQTESQNLLYQSIAIKDFAKRIDSVHSTILKQIEKSHDQIFAIEQALQSNQMEKAQALYRVLKKSSSIPNENVKSLVQEWIQTGVENIPKQKALANQAFENSQKLTDESIQLLIEAQDLRESAKNKSNAFKRRETTVEAKNKESLAVQKRDQADKQLSYGTKLYEEIKKIEAIKPIIHEFPTSVILAKNSQPILNPEKRKSELDKRLDIREKEVTFSPISIDKLLAQDYRQKLNLENIPKMNDLITYETQRYKAQLIADELDLNKRETVVLLQASKKLNGSAAIENTKKITLLRKEADSLQTASTQAFILAGDIYKQLSPKDRKRSDNSLSNFENYLKSVRNRIAQLLDDVTLLSEQASETKDETSRDNLMRQADEKEQIAMYLILEEYEIIAQRNMQSYRKNAMVIDNLAEENLSQQEKELMQAIFGKIESFMLQAASNRIKANNQELSFTLMKVLLQDAFSHESSALDLQLEAIRIMREEDMDRMLAFQPTTKTHNQDKLIATKENIPSLDESLKQVNENSVPKLKPVPETKEKESIVAIAEPKKTTVKTETIPKKQNKENPIVIANESQRNVHNEQKLKDAINPEGLKLVRIKAPHEKVVVTTTNERSQEKQTKKPENEAKNTDLLKAFPNVHLAKKPNGNQFSIQVAATITLKTTDKFLNVIELFALKDNEKELYRYFSGEFTTLKSAIIRRNSLRQQGYSDAFIKSWKDGKIVNIVEASDKLDKSSIALLKETNIPLPNQYRNINFSATNISQLNGVYYSVQVGVYSRPRSSAQLFNIKPLYHNRLKNGNWVYFNGIFKSIDDAEKNKTTIRSNGVSDAFVVAFNEGEKVSLVNARRAITQGNSPPNDEDIIILEDASIEIDSQLKTIVSPSNTPLIKKVYKVQIGVFSTTVSFDWATSKLRDTENQTIEYFITNTGKYVYTIGSFKTYEEALDFNTKKIKEIIKDSFIVTFENGKKVNAFN